jgi:hypothetical protein
LSLQSKAQTHKRKAECMKVMNTIACLLGQKIAEKFKSKS